MSTTTSDKSIEGLHTIVLDGAAQNYAEPLELLTVPAGYNVEFAGTPKLTSKGNLLIHVWVSKAEEKKESTTLVQE